MIATLVGRTAEFDRLAALLDTAVAQGRGGGASVSGEPGIGKTALVGAVTEHARRSGWAVLEGRGHDLESRLDYGPLAAALAGYLHRLPAERRAAYCAGLDSLGALVEGIGAPGRPAGHPDGPDPSRSRLFQSVALLLGRVAADAPVLLVVDDLHWADPASIDVLSYLRADLDALGVVLLVALRAPVEAARADVRRLVAELARLPLHAAVAVHRLDAAEVSALAAAHLGGPVHPELTDLLAVRSAGTPLVVQAMVHDLVARGALTDGPAGWRCTEPDPDVPAHVRELFGAGLDRLGDPARRLLATVCLGGSPVPHPRLAALTGADDVELGEAVAALRAEGLLAERRRHGRARYEPSHPLVADAVLAATAEATGAHIHARYVEVLEAEGEIAPHVLARHYLGARDLLGAARVAPVLAEAGRVSLRRGAPTSAARWLSAAVDVAGPDDAGRALLDLGLAEQQCGDTAGSVRTLMDAAERLRRSGDRPAAAVAAGQSARLAWLVDDRDTTRRASAMSVEMAADGDPRMRIFSALAHAVTLMLLDDAAGAEAVVARVEAELGSVAGDGQRERLAGYVGYARAVVGNGDAAEALRRLSTPVPPDPATLFLDIACSNARMELAVLLGAWARVDEELTVARQLAEAGPGTPRLWRSPIAAFHRLWATGDWDGAADALTEMASDQAATAPAAAALAPERHAMAVWSALHRGEITGVDRIGVPAAPDGTPVVLHWPERALGEVVATLVAARNGSVPTAPVPSTWLVMFEGWRRIAQVEALAARQDRTGLRDEAAALTRVGGTGSALDALAERAMMLAATDRATTARHADAAADANDRLGMPVAATTVRVECGERAGPTKAGRDRLRADLALLDRIGARPLAGRVRGLLGGGPAPAGPAQLSPREREVAELVADGLSNAAIAERLVVSVRTVTSHLDHAYTKLGIGSRTELAREIRTSPDARGTARR